MKIRAEIGLITLSIIGVIFISGCIDHVLPYLEFNSTSCKEDVDLYNMTDEIISERWEDSNLQIKVRVFANCCTDKEGDFSIDGNKITLFLEESGPSCNCVCAFDLTYSIWLIEKMDYDIDFRRRGYLE